MVETKLIGHPWNFSKLWNQAIATLPERTLQKRSHIWASELGLAFVDRYLKMHAFPMSNPPNERSKRKFISGHIWEWLIGFILTLCGVLKARQLRGEVQLPGLLKVTGKLDFIAGGDIDWELAKVKVKELQALFATSLDEMPAFVMHAVTHIMAQMEEQYAHAPLKEYIFENKSVSARIFEKLEKTDRPLAHHVLQCYHYLIPQEITEAKLNYICKDDCIMMEFDIENSPVLMRLYKEDVATMTEYYNNSNKKNPLKTMPPKEPEVLFVDGVFRFEKNFNVEYSNYLEFLYGYKTPEIFRSKWQKIVSDYNRVFKRIVTGQKFTALNNQVYAQMKKDFPAVDKYIHKAKSIGIFAVGTEDEENV